MLTTQDLQQKGFKLVQFDDKSEFYSITIYDSAIVERVYGVLGEDIGQFDYDLAEVEVTIEINPDFTFAQYLFSDEPSGGDWFVHGELSIEEFTKLIDVVK